jgi:hypothetical protein
MYDIIGDVHGHATHLKKLLLDMGYAKKPEGYLHPGRKAIFVGDFVNRGPEIRKTIRIIRKMVENGNALAILGNHELNTIIPHISDKKGIPLVKPPLKNFVSVIKTINEFAACSEEWKSHLSWLRTLPLFLNWKESALSMPAGPIRLLVTLKQICRRERLKRGIQKTQQKHRLRTNPKYMADNQRNTA